MGTIVSWIWDKFSPSLEDFSAYDEVLVDFDSINAPGKLGIRTEHIQSLEDVEDIINQLRQGRSIYLLHIGGLKESGDDNFKKGVQRLKKVCQGIGGDIAGLSHDWIIVTSSIAEVSREKER